MLHTEAAVKTTGRKVPGKLKPPRVLEALSASGLRAPRYAREIEGIGQVVALDNDKVSVEACRRNIKFNGSVACSRVESHLADARVYMLTHPKEFDVKVIWQCFLGVMGRFTIPKPCKSIQAMHHSCAICPDGLLHSSFCSNIHASGQLIMIEFGLSSAMKNTPLKLSYVYQCTGCDSFHLQPTGGLRPTNDCGKKFNMGRAIWSALIHDQEWVNSILGDVKSMKDQYPAFDRISAELPDVPHFLSLHNLCATLKCTSPSAVMFRSAVINAGYRISGTHVNPLGFKSDAPMNVIWDIT